MKELQKRQRIKRIVYSVPSLFLLSVVSFFLARGALRVLDKANESSRLSKDLEAQAVILTLREQELNEDIRRLQTEEGVKEEIKERFSVTQEGEHVAVVVDERRAASSTEEGKLSWYKRFWIAIMGNK